MAALLTGAPVAVALSARSAALTATLRNRGVVPTLAVVRVGERSDDLAYERSAEKRCAAAGAELRRVPLPADVDAAGLLAVLRALSAEDAVHGILLLRPLPPGLDEAAACAAIAPEKDVDGCTAASLAGVFIGAARGFPPCTAQAVMELLDYYGVACAGKRACVIGRSLVVGRPVALLLLQRDATVTLCHSKTADLPAAAREADLLVVCAGRQEAIGAAYLRAGQTVVDVGIHWNEARGRLCGDVRFDEAEGLVAAITPVPGGVGGVTAAVLAEHTAQAAARQSGLADRVLK